MADYTYDEIVLDGKVTLALGKLYDIKPKFDPRITTKVIGKIISMKAVEGHLIITFVTDQKYNEVPISTTITVGIIDKKAFSTVDSGKIDYRRKKSRSLTVSKRSSTSSTRKGGASVRRRKTSKK